jgi:MFS family permease
MIKLLYSRSILLHSTRLPDRFNHRLMGNPLILPLYLPALLLSVAQGLLLPVLPLFVQDFTPPIFWVGLVLAGEGLGLLLGDLPAGLLLRQINQRTGMLLGIGMVGAATLALFWSPSVVIVLLFRILSGLGWALYNVSRHTYIADVITVATRGRSVALLGGTFRLGRMIGPLVGGGLAAAAGLRAVFPLFAGICLLAWLAIWLFNHGQVPGLAPTAQPVSLASYISTIRREARRITFPGLGNFLMQLVRAAPAVAIPLYASTVLGLEVNEIGWVFGASSGIDMLLFYPTGMIMDRLGRKWAIVPSALIMAAGLMLIPFAHSLAVLALAAMLNGFGNGLGSGVMLTLGADLSPKQARGEFLGIWGLIGDAGNTSGPVIFGGLAEVMALQPAIWVIACSGLAAGLVFGLLVPETLKKDRAPAD